METITVKIHNVFHDESDFSASDVEEYIERGLGNTVESARIASGHTNSPIYLTLSSNSLFVNNIKSICRQAVGHFGHRVDGVDASISDKNIMIVNRR